MSTGANSALPLPPEGTADVGVVIVAAGASTRAGTGELKQLRWLAGKPMLLHSLQTFMARPDVVSVVCVLPTRYAGDPPPWIFQCDVDRLMIAPGGATRTESVANGLDDLPDEGFRGRDRKGERAAAPRSGIHADLFAAFQYSSRAWPP